MIDVAAATAARPGAGRRPASPLRRRHPRRALGGDGRRASPRRSSERGVQVGVLLGTAYLFTHEAVDTGAIVRGFQEAALELRAHGDCSRPAPAMRAGGDVAFRRGFPRPRAASWSERAAPAKRSARTWKACPWAACASRARRRSAPAPTGGCTGCRPRARSSEGMYMIGQVATLCATRSWRIADLHRESARRATRCWRIAARRSAGSLTRAAPPRPADVAIVGLAACFPEAGDIAEFWENILNRRDAISEIPRHRWDWRLYFDANRTRTGQDLLEVGRLPRRRAVRSACATAFRRIALSRRSAAAPDAGGRAPGAGRCGLRASRAFERERISIILGASGGAGDVGAQYAVRAEMPRFAGELDPRRGRRGCRSGPRTASPGSC